MVSNPATMNLSDVYRAKQLKPRRNVQKSASGKCEAISHANAQGRSWMLVIFAVSRVR